MGKKKIYKLVAISNCDIYFFKNYEWAAYKERREEKNSRNTLKL